MNSSVHFKIGRVTIGGTAPVVIQSMTNTDTADVVASVAQCKRMIDSGAQMVRLTVPSMKEVAPLARIQAQLRAEGFLTPIVADVHFNPNVAEAVAPFVEKVRINPGNYVDKRVFASFTMTDTEYDEAVHRMAERAAPLLSICKQHDTAIRVGINQGSLCDRIINRYGNTPEAMVHSALEWLDICESMDFRKLVFSMKSSNVYTMIRSTTLLHEAMKARGVNYPLHIGVTEAGCGLEGRVKSAAGIGALLLMGVGDTVRVSLTEPPEDESPFAHKLVQALTSLHPQNAVIQDDTLYFSEDCADIDAWTIRAAAMAGYAYYKHHIKDIQLENGLMSQEVLQDLRLTILQACRIRMSKTEFISCPSCGRTQYDIQHVVAMVKERFPNHPGLKLGIMGCIVNGPGEMADADYGVVGAAHGHVCLYHGKEKLTNPIPVEEALDALEKLIKNNCP